MNIDNQNEKDDKSSMNALQSTNWKGSIPVMLSLAPSSLSSPTMPPSVHRMVPRQSYLHISLEDDVRRLHDYAPMVVNFKSVQQVNDDDGENGEDGENGDTTGDGNGDGNGDGENEGNHSNDVTQSNNFSPYPICWFEDEETGAPLRWHFFAGILYDHMKLRHSNSGQNNSNSPFLPWKIRVHYTSYPASILPLQINIPGKNDHQKENTVQKNKSMNEKDNDEDGVPHLIFRHFLNSLKQALYIQHNSNKTVKNMTKNSHLQLWDGIKRSRFEVYSEIANGLNGHGSSSNGSTGDGCVGSNITLENIPIRVLVDSRPAFARPCNPYYAKDDGSGNSKTMLPTTIGIVLHQWLPHLFPSIDGNINDNENNDEVSTKCVWLIQGLKVPFTAAVADLWKGLCHPDRFLYIIIVTDSKK